MCVDNGSFLFTLFFWVEFKLTLDFASQGFMFTYSGFKKNRIKKCYVKLFVQT